MFLLNLKTGHTSSCGCLASKLAGNRVRTHGLSKTKEFKCWQDMLNRALNPDHKYADKYSKLVGGVEPEWISDFLPFYNYLGPQPDDSSVRWSVGRIDNEVGYIKGNIRWEDSYQQNRNRGKTIANTSGTMGVTWRESGSRWGRAVATWYELDGKQGSKSFSAKVIGKDAAIKQAAEYRQRKIENLSRGGAEYGEKHGK